jgi:two-component system phosphate regulon response regulator OmpR
MPETAPHILVVDDDTRIRELLRKYLVENGFRVTTAPDAAAARANLAGLDFDLLVLDVMMPGEDGLELTRAIRRDSGVPILLLTAMGEPDDRINGFERGADDYLVKPFEPRELVLRIQTILRRTRTAIRTEIRLGSHTFDLPRERLLHGDRPVRLTTNEASLLRSLARNAGVTMSRDALIRDSRIEGNARTVDVQVTRLRRKIEPDPRAPRYLQTVRGQGYVLVPD